MVSGISVKWCLLVLSGVSDLSSETSVCEVHSEMRRKGLRGNGYGRERRHRVVVGRGREGVRKGEERGGDL